MGNYLANEKGKRFIGWDEILEGGLAPGAIVESWRGTGGGKAAAVAGHDVIMSPQSHCYFDHAYEPPAGSNARRGTPAVPLDKVYNFDPTPAGLTTEQAKHILGAEGTVWSEHIPNGERADYMTFPRTCALAEALWTAPPFTKGVRDFGNFEMRLAEHFRRMKGVDVAYFDDPVAHAPVIATWTAGDFEKRGSTRDYDVTGMLKGPGAFGVRFDFTNGANKLEISSVSLTENGVEIGKDAHPGTAGGSSRATLYTLTVPTPTKGAAGAKYVLHVTAAADTGADTTGDILFLPASPNQ